MRTTLSLDPDVVAAVERLRREEELGLSEAVNALVRSGLAARSASGHEPYQPRSIDVGIKVDVSNVAETLDLLDAG
ncbi:ribbon-helix-helix protein, CopG family [Solicola gregarius]|uniref:Ribbon-helix-helix protein, CopG family n=1 Tax=Solicola gregarius TaxID=2908642 RepID=A0AA46THH8_9ACTN|nr:ribbon-helix-helix protein, CopG family [Solicola gregarius]UYM05268.1 ribbon-helix-helix protein, CopG family [Solicola gregarius]